MRVLLLCSSFNGLTQRIQRELTQLGHTTSVELAISPEIMIEAVQLFGPDIIICPFLKHRVPPEIWRHYKCLVVHPGIEGDRGPSSLDWAITNDASEWGVTLVQAAEEMDAGDIWGTETFSLRQTTKASVYRREVTAAASRLVFKALESASDRKFKPKPLNYTDPNVTGRLMRPIKQYDRKIDWQLDDTATIVRKINAADSSPGVLSNIAGLDVYLYDAHPAVGLIGKPGQLLAQSHGAVCRATVDGAVWITHLKDARVGIPQAIKLPAVQVLGNLSQELPHIETDGPTSIDSGLREIDYQERDQIGYVYFRFYNGAMNAQHCRRLRRALIQAKKRPTKAIVLMGGEEFWSNGIHLNCVEAAVNPADESWDNINAMDDLVEEVLTTDKQITIAALRTNAGAGGAVLAAACDHVAMREGVVLNAHYRTMGLYGSEYWTYILPKRVGEKNAQRLTEGCLPLIAGEALEIGLADCVLSEDWTLYHEQLQTLCRRLVGASEWRRRINGKNKQRAQDEKSKPLQHYRDAELKEMRRIFYDPQSEYHTARRNFVHKIAADSTPLRIAMHRGKGQRQTNAA